MPILNAHPCRGMSLYSLYVPSGFDGRAQSKANTGWVSPQSALATIALAGSRAGAWGLQLVPVLAGTYHLWCWMSWPWQGARLELEGLEPKPGVSPSFSCNLVMFVALAGEGPGPECLEQQLNVSFVISLAWWCLPPWWWAGQELEKLKPEPAGASGRQPEHCAVFSLLLLGPGANKSLCELFKSKVLVSTALSHAPLVSIQRRGVFSSLLLHFQMYGLCFLFFTVPFLICFSIPSLITLWSENIFEIYVTSVHWNLLKHAFWPGIGVFLNVLCVLEKNIYFIVSMSTQSILFIIFRFSIYSFFLICQLSRKCALPSGMRNVL